MIAELPGHGLACRRLPPPAPELKPAAPMGTQRQRTPCLIPVCRFAGSSVPTVGKSEPILPRALAGKSANASG